MTFGVVWLAAGLAGALAFMAFWQQLLLGLGPRALWIALAIWLGVGLARLVAPG